MGAGQQESRTSHILSANPRERNVEDGEQQIEENSSKFLEDEAMNLHSSNHPGMNLVSAPLTGVNFLSWSRSIKIPLGAKTKLSFIEGTQSSPPLDSQQDIGWKKADRMVLSWLVNSISKDISESFIFANSSRDLWLEIEARFDDSNGHMIYQIHREINNTLQGNMSVTQYYSKHKPLWDELSCLESIPNCVCGAATTMSCLHETHRVM